MPRKREEEEAEEEEEEEEEAVALTRAPRRTSRRNRRYVFSTLSTLLYPSREKALQVSSPGDVNSRVSSLRKERHTTNSADAEICS
jgi:hypothetical protein